MQVAVIDVIESCVVNKFGTSPILSTPLHTCSSTTPRPQQSSRHVEKHNLKGRR